MLNTDINSQLLFKQTVKSTFNVSEAQFDFTESFYHAVEMKLVIKVRTPPPS